MTIELDQATEKLIEHQIALGKAPDAKTLIQLALRSFASSSKAQLTEDEARARRQAAADAIRELRRGVTLGPDLTIRDLIEEGRR